MAELLVSSLKRNSFNIKHDKIKHHRLFPMGLILELTQQVYCFEIRLELEYPDKNTKYFNVGVFSSYSEKYELTKEEIEKIRKNVKRKKGLESKVRNEAEEMNNINEARINKAITDSEKFYERTLKILENGNYELHLYDSGKMDFVVDGILWKAYIE